MSKLYPYIGPSAIRDRVTHQRPGSLIQHVQDLLGWVGDTCQRPGLDGLVAATFVIDPSGRLLLADRRSEHVVCAGGGQVLSAGEAFFRIFKDRVEVVEVSNQSTGYCPEPCSWPAVAAAFDQVGIVHPAGFTMDVVFRRCTECGERNVVRDGWFVCGLCGADLSAEWNFSE